MADWATEFRFDIPDLIKRLLVLSFERVILAEITPDACPDLEIVELAIGIERSRISVVISGNIEGPLA
jgi:hypothetical protein